MLRLENIIKNYKTGNTEFPALKGISLAFRKNEFVSILGPSGCGKTTLLNIIGGLDHYTSGDLVIEGKSTKEYKSHDWDVYRNHRIGFIFQSYNLIPHQNILQNVELALTIAGYSKEEKRKKAMNALDMVGLKGSYKKMPNQLSGGQCQRVAIARALVNEPDILLGDEPTGALDSKTSVQIMELIKKISKTKLVIMVTHNPPLAKKYSSRIISLLDGNVVGDTNQYKLEAEKKEKREQFKGVKTSDKGEIVKPSKAKMSFWSAFKLSARNLISKRKRTIMVIAASSIGIVGVSAVLAVSSGVKGYIGSMENDMLSGNPVRVSETSLDLTSVLTNLSDLVKAQSVSEAWKGDYIDIEYLTRILIENASSGSIITNDISDNYVEYIKEMPKEYLTDYSLDYGTSFANNIYTVSNVLETETEFKDQKVAYSLSGLKNIYTSILAYLDDGKGTSYVPIANLAANFPNVFYQGLDNNDYIKDQFEMVGNSRLPADDADDECVVVLNRRNKLPDLVITLAGMLSEKNFMTAMYEFIKENPDMEKIEKMIKLKINDILNQEIYYIPNDINGKSAAFSPNYITPKGSTITIENPITPYSYSYKFKKEIDGDKTYLSNGDTKLEVTGKEGEAKKIKIVGIITPKEGKRYSSLYSGIYFKSPLANKIRKNNQQSEIYNYMTKEKVVEVLEEKVVISKERKSYENAVFIPNDESKREKESHFVGLYYPLKFQNYKKENEEIVPGDIIETYGTVGESNIILTDYDDPFAPAESLTINKGTLIKSSLSSRDLAGMKAIDNGKKTESGNPDYDYQEVVYRMYLYNSNFTKKDNAIKYLDRWNSKTEYITIDDPKNPGQQITLAPVGSKEANARNYVHYTDNLTLIIAMINNLINVTTISLTIFAGLSLVVSTVMIGIITYISVMERIKEIGVIRSLGGRKKDVSHLFNAETFILGGLSGLFGILITYIFELILDIVIYANFKIPMIANLKWYTAVIMIVLSIILTAVSGLIPAKSAANKDPVNALRSE